MIFEPAVSDKNKGIIMDVKPKTLAVVMLFFAFLSLITVTSYAVDRGAKEVSDGILGRILRIEGLEGDEALYVGAESGLYRTLDSGKSWSNMPLSGDAFHVRDIAVGPDDIFIVADGGVYHRYIAAPGEKKPGISWERLPGKTDIVGVYIRRQKKTEKPFILVWSSKELYHIKDGSWFRMGPEMMSEPISDVICDGRNIYVASGKNIFASHDGGGVWKEISLMTGDGDAAEGDETYVFEENEEGQLPPIRNLDLYGSGGAIAATETGIFLIPETGRSLERVDTTGLPSAHVRYAISTEKGLVAATDRRVFLYSNTEECWKVLFEATFPGAISFLKQHMDENGRNRLWIAAGRYIYRLDIDDFPEKRTDTVDMEDRFREYGTEIPICEVHRMAIEYAEVSPDKIKRWRRGARWKAILPRLSVKFSESNDENIDIYKSATTAYIIRGPREINNDWGMDLTWDLSDLIWNNSQTIIDVRSKLMVQLRDDILEEVTRLYFERKRLLTEIAGEGERTGEGEGTRRKVFLEKRLRVEELTAYIDAFTGGKFSETINTNRGKWDTVF